MIRKTYSDAWGLEFDDWETTIHHIPGIEMHEGGFPNNTEHAEKQITSKCAV